jgi:hypothetical protein
MRLHAAEGYFTEVDDTGGGDGVEFYQRRKNGNEWGWQAKFYDGSVRLSLSGRKRKIIDSLKRALQNHPDLERWILCTNSQFTREEQKWFDTQLKSHVPRKRRVALEHWSEGKIQGKLDQPECIGIKNAFFEVLQLTSDWFQGNFDKVENLVEGKYIHELHTKDHQLYYDYLGPLLINADFCQRCSGGVRHVEHQYEEFVKAVETIKGLHLTDMDWPLREKYIATCEQTRLLLQQTVSRMKEILKLVAPNTISEARQYQNETFNKPIEEYKESLFNLNREHGPEFKTDYVPKDDRDKGRLPLTRNKVHDPIYHMEKMMEEISYFIRDIGMSDSHHQHLLGNAGIGKTHICTSIARDYLDAKKPAIFIPASKFTEHSNIENQFLDLLDIKSKYSFGEFLDTLNALGILHNVRVPLIIDGLNESVNEKGMLNPRWKKDIRGLEQQVSTFSNIVLLTTCRRSYQKEIWLQDNKSNIDTYYGIHDEDKKEMIRKYFKKYRIICDLTYASLSHFSNPLFLNIFCQTKSSPSEDVYLQLGNDSIFDIFGQFIGKCDKSVYERLTNYGNPPGKDASSVASRFTVAISQKLWEKNARSLDVDIYRKVFKIGGEQNYSTSKAKALIDEGLLLVRDWGLDGENVGFTFDMIAGFSIASYLIDTHKSKLKELVISKKFTERLISQNYKTRHPLAEDILECFIALVPIKTGRHLIDIIPRQKKLLQLANDSFFTFFKISGKFIRTKDVRRGSSVFDRWIAEHRVMMMERASEVFFVPSHPLNFLFFSKKLFSLSLTQKDLCLGEFLRSRDETYLTGIVQEFESKNAQSYSFSLPEQEAVNDIVAEWLCWALSTNMILYRKEVSKALYVYGRKHPQKFFALFSKFLQADDIYIREKIMSIAFGLVSAACKERESSENVFQMVRLTYKLFFKPRAPLATTHILLRDYAAQLIDIGCRTYPQLKKEINLKLIRSPFKNGGIRRWRSVNDKNKKEYKDGNSLIDFFFEKDHFPRLTKSDVYKPNEKAKQAKGRLLWRAYGLGYQYKDFADIDQRIARWNGYGRDEKKVEKYGEKYIWIAYYELAGYMDDIGILEHYYESGWPVRMFGEGFDPTFPDPLPERRYFEKDIIGNRKVSIRAWLQRDNIPDVKEILIVNDLTDEKENYVLMDCHKTQTDEAAQRQVFFWLTSIFVSKDMHAAAKKAVITKNVTGEIQPKYHETIFSGEYPKSEYFPRLAKREIDWAFTRKKVRCRYSKEVLYYNSRPLSKKKQDEVWRELEEKYSFRDEFRNRGFQKEYTNDKGELLGPIHLRIVYSHSPENLDTIIKTELKNRKYELRTIYKYVNEWEKVTKPVEIFMPVIDSNIGTTIAKELAEALNLDSGPGTTDLFESNGNRATISFHYGDKYNNNHRFLYLRKDLLDFYLKKQQLIFFWSFEGEWNHWLMNGFVQHMEKPHWRKFTRTIDYSIKSKR